MKMKQRRTRVRRVWPLLPAAFLFAILMTYQAAPVSANEEQTAEQLVASACMTLDNFMSDPKMEAFRDLLKKAKAVVIAPRFLKGAFVVGASGGSAAGVVLDQKTGQWSAPAFYRMGGASFGLQIGGQSSELILLAMTERGVNSLLGNSVKLGVGAGVAAGPVGIGAQAATANISADILSFSRSAGLYGGVSVDGAVIGVRAALNEAYYGKKVSPTDIFIRRDVTDPGNGCLARSLSKDAGSETSASPAEK